MLLEIYNNMKPEIFNFILPSFAGGFSLFLFNIKMKNYENNLFLNFLIEILGAVIIGSFISKYKITSICESFVATSFIIGISWVHGINFIKNLFLNQAERIINSPYRARTNTIPFETLYKMNFLNMSEEKYKLFYKELNDNSTNPFENDLIINIEDKSISKNFLKSLKNKTLENSITWNFETIIRSNKILEYYETIIDNTSIKVNSEYGILLDKELYTIDKKDFNELIKSISLNNNKNSLSNHINKLY